MGKKEILATLIDRFGALTLVTKAAAQTIIVLGYHRIRDDGGIPEHAFDEHLFGPTQSHLERQLKWLKANFTVLSESDLLTVLSQPRFKDRAVVVTFDDGYRDNYTLAYPVLRAHSVPAVFFVCPGLIDRGTLGWWDLIAYLVKQSTRPTIAIDGQNIQLIGRKTSVIGMFNARMKRRPHSETADLIPRLAEACAVELPPSEVQCRELMSWNEVREVSGNGVAIASHTHTHRVLATLSKEDQLWELLESKARLEQQVGRPVRTVAYPAGNRSNFTEETKQLALECGYAGGFSYHSGFNMPGHVDLYDIARIAPSDDFDAMFRCTTAIPRMFAWVHRPE